MISMAVRFNLPSGPQTAVRPRPRHPRLYPSRFSALLCRGDAHHPYISHLPLAVLATFLHDLVNHYVQVSRDCLNSHHQCLCRLPLLCSIQVTDFLVTLPLQATRRSGSCTSISEHPASIDHRRWFNHIVDATTSTANSCRHSIWSHHPPETSLWLQCFATGPLPSVSRHDLNVYRPGWRADEYVPKQTYISKARRRLLCCLQAELSRSRAWIFSCSGCCAKIDTSWRYSDRPGHISTVCATCPLTFFLHPLHLHKISPWSFHTSLSNLKIMMY